jgi:hypothetical protein
MGRLGGRAARKDPKDLERRRSAVPMGSRDRIQRLGRQGQDHARGGETGTRSADPGWVGRRGEPQGGCWRWVILEVESIDVCNEEIVKLERFGAPGNVTNRTHRIIRGRT